MSHLLVYIDGIYFYAGHLNCIQYSEPGVLLLVFLSIPFTSGNGALWNPTIPNFSVSLSNQAWSVPLSVQV